MSAKKRSNLDAMIESPWALLPNVLGRIVDRVRQGAVDLEAAALDGPHDGAMRMGGVSVIPVYGVIEHRSDWMMEMFGGVSIDGLRESLRAELNDPAVRAVILDFDSPGGSIAGVTELAAEIRNARGGAKPIVAVANTLAASAAYWLASQADEVVVTPSGHVGSIGVYAIHQDISKMLDGMGVATTIISAGEHKTEGNEFEPLSDEARADIQSRVDASYQQFIADVAEGRKITTGQVEADYGGGRMLTARKALAVGMVDRVETIAQTVQRLGSPVGRRRAMAAEGDPVDLLAEDGEDAPTLLPPFTERVAALASEASQLVGHASERARLRAKEGRPAFSSATETSLRTIRGAIDTLLAPDEPEPSPVTEPGEPAPAPAEEPAVEPPEPEAPATPPIAASIPRRFRSREDWLRHLETHP